MIRVNSFLHKYITETFFTTSDWIEKASRTLIPTVLNKTVLTRESRQIKLGALS